MSDPLISEQTIERVPPTGIAAALPWVKWLMKTVVEKGVKTFEFNFGRLLVNRSDAPDTDSCAGYAIAEKEDAANTFVECDVAQDFHEGPDVQDSGALIGREIDWMGARGRKQRGAGLMLVVGRSGRSSVRDPNDHGVAHLPPFIQLYQYYHDLGFVKCDGLIRSYMKTEQGIVQMVGGDCIRYSEDPAVPVHTFDPQTGVAGWWFPERRFCVDGVQVATGQKFTMHQF